MKKVIAVMMAMLIGAFAAVPCAAAENVQTRLYNVYGDSMLFQQKAEAILAGVGTPGESIACAVKNSAGTVIESCDGVVDSTGEFRLSFTAPEGGYEEYTLELTAGGEVFDTLENVVFGELWLSSGQSNMQLEMKYSRTGMEMQKNNTTGSKNVRYFYSAPNPQYNGSADNMPLKPQKEIPGCRWFDGTDSGIFNISGLGFFFAEELSRELDMPVGLLSGSLGGSLICAWLPREAVEKDKNIIKLVGSNYISESKWQEDGGLNPMTVCSGMFNKKISPLANFRPAGMIWDQGESDSSRAKGEYTDLFRVLQDSYSGLFGFGSGKMPIVYPALCDFSFGNMNAFKLLSSEFAEMREEAPESRALISVSDVPLTFTVATQVCHPIEKQPVGERMAYSALGLVYGKNDCFTAAAIKSSEVRDGSVYITYRNCGDTLKAKGDRIYGFTVCGNDGVYVPAEAELVSPDTVRVYSAGVKEPAAAMYANGLITERCNLWSFKDGEYIMPVLPTVTDWSKIDRIATDFGWLDCDTEEIWREESLVIAGKYKIWGADNAEVSVSPDSAFKGAGGLKISGNGAFSVKPIMEYTDENGQQLPFCEFDGRWQNYSTLSFSVRNDGKSDVTFTGLKINRDGKTVCPVVQGTAGCSAVIPADGQWHEIRLDLEKLYFSGKKLPLTATRALLNDVTGVEFCFDGGELSLDEIGFETTGRAVPPVKLAGFFGPPALLFNLISYIVGLFLVK